MAVIKWWNMAELRQNGMNRLKRLKHTCGKAGPDRYKV